MEPTRTNAELDAQNANLSARVKLMQAHQATKLRAEQYEAALGLIVMIVIHHQTDISQWVAVAEEDVTITYPRPGGEDYITTQVGRQSPIWQVIEALLGVSGSRDDSEAPKPSSEPCPVCGGGSNFCRLCGG
jgi:hypothetical protein